MKFVILCGILTFAVVILNCGQTSLMLNNELRKADERLDHLVHSMPKHDTTPDKRSPLSLRGDQTLDRKIDPGRLRTNYQTKVTALIYSREESPDCFRQRIGSVFAHFPNITVIGASSKSLESNFVNVEILTDIPHEGEAIEKMLAKVKTEYFLYLAPGVSLAGNDVDSSVIWLFHALQNVAGLDFVGGSYVRHNPGEKYPTLEIPCYRLRLCNWTMSQSFESQYSIGDMMVCEETSSSFMGRMNSLAKVGHFDSYLTTMATTDFFLRAKGRALVGLRPEVKFIETEPCLGKHMTASNEADIKFPFMRKHQLLVLKDSFRTEVKAIDSKYYFSIDYHKKPSTYGNPFRTQGILRSLEIAADFLESEDIPYYVDAGTSLGAVKMRGILPWDVDADLQFYADGHLVKKGLERFIKQRGIEGHVETYTTTRGQFTLRFFTGVIGFVELFEIPKVVPPSKRFLYIDLHGRQYPIEEVLFSSLRRQYGNTFLEMWPNHGKPRECVFQKDHHSCLPEEFMQGGGHWRDYYCEL